MDAHATASASRADVLLIMGSVRAGRRCPQIAAWVKELIRPDDPFTATEVDLRDWHLPPDDEAAIPALGAYATAHTRAWSERVAAAKGIVIITPQYNWGYPAALKNALDHLYREWNGKPLLIITYGGHGGGKCAAQLRQVAEGLKMRATAAAPAITVPREAIESGAAMTPQTLAPFAADVRAGLDELALLLASSAPAA